MFRWYSLVGVKPKVAMFTWAKKVYLETHDAVCKAFRPKTAIRQR